MYIYNYIYITIYIYIHLIILYIYLYTYMPTSPRTHHSLGTWRPWEPRQTRRVTGNRHGHGDLMVILLGIS